MEVLDSHLVNTTAEQRANHILWVILVCGHNSKYALPWTGVRSFDHLNN